MATDIEDLSAEAWHCVMGVPLQPRETIRELSDLQDGVGIARFNKALFANVLHLWRTQERFNAPYQAVESWARTPMPDHGSTIGTDSFLKFWGRAEKGGGVKKHLPTLMHFTKLDATVDPTREMLSGAQIKRHLEHLDRHLRVSEAAELRPGFYDKRSGPSLAALVLDLLALDEEMSDAGPAPENMKKPQRQDAAAQTMAVELILLRMAQGLLLHKAAFTNAFEAHLSHEVALPEWPIDVAQRLLADGRTEPWVALLALGGSLGLHMRQLARDRLLPGLGEAPGVGAATAWLQGLLSPENASPDAPAHLQNVIKLAQSAREPLQEACDRLGLGGLPKFAYGRLLVRQATASREIRPAADAAR